jgi:ankyrin repeat protein
LFIAAEAGYLEIVQRLIENNADINMKENDGWTALHIGRYRLCLKI